MKRTIKFRGKNAVGEWVYGSLIMDKYENSNGQVFDVAFIVPGLPCVSQPNDMWTAKMLRVQADSVGQFTGLHDKNGKEIYEGDIIKHTKGLTRKDESSDWKEDNTIMEVCYRDAGFNIDSLSHSKTIEVIGDIHSNPEILEKVNNPC